MSAVGWEWQTASWPSSRTNQAPPVRPHPVTRDETVVNGGGWGLAARAARPPLYTSWPWRLGPGRCRADRRKSSTTTSWPAACRPAACHSAGPLGEGLRLRRHGDRVARRRPARRPDGRAPNGARPSAAPQRTPVAAQPGRRRAGRGDGRAFAGQRAGRLASTSNSTRSWVLLADADERPALERWGSALATFGVTGVTDATRYQRRRTRWRSSSKPWPRATCHSGCTCSAGICRRAGPSPPVDRCTQDRVGGACLAHPRRPGGRHCRRRRSRGGHPLRDPRVPRPCRRCPAGGNAGFGPYRARRGGPARGGVAARRTAVTIVTQPGFVRTNGDRYRRDVEQCDLPWLYRLRGWTERGIHVAGSSDAPFGDADPWSAMRAATERRTAAGARLGLDESLSPEEALGLYLAPLDDSGGPQRRVCPGAAADLCPWLMTPGVSCVASSTHRTFEPPTWAACRRWSPPGEGSSRSATFAREPVPRAKTGAMSAVRGARP